MGIIGDLSGADLFFTYQLNMPDRTGNRLFIFRYIGK